MLCLRRGLLVAFLACAWLSVSAAPSLASTGGISGTVTDSQSGPISNVFVSVYDSSHALVTSVFTASDGTYSVTGLAPGSYEVGFQSTSGNFAPQYYSGKASIAAADIVTVSGGVTTANVNATLSQGGEVTGIVQDTSHAGIAGESVQVLDASGNVLGSANTAPDGSYTVVGLASGIDYVVFTGGNYVTQYYNNRSSLAAANPISVTAGSTTSGVNATMVVGGGITGTVTDGTTALSGATVSALSSGGTPVGSATTRPDGTYTLAGLPVGTYKLRFSRAGYVTQYYSGQSSLAAANSVSVSAGGTTPGIDAAMVRTGQVTGAVTDGANALQNVEVAAYDGSGNQVTAVCTAADGTYTLTDLPAGSYSIGFDTAADGLCPTTNYLGQYYANESMLGSADPVTVASGATTPGVDATMQPAGQIAGTVTDGANPLHNIEVDVYNAGGTRMGLPVCTAADGTYTVSGLPTGSYRVGFNIGSRTCGNPNYLPQYYNAAATLTSADPVSVTAGSTSGGVNATMEHAGEITGRVTDGTSPLQNIEVDVYTGGTSPLEETCTAADGTYTLSGLASGSYQVGFNTSGLDVCGASNYLPQYYNAEPTLVSADTVPVTAPNPSPNVNATLSAGARISGRVTDRSSGSGVSSIRVSLLDTGGNPVASTSSDATGNYTFVGLQDGTYEVEFSDPSGAYVTQYYNGEPTFGTADAVAVTSTSPASGVDAALVTAITRRLTIGQNPGTGSGTVTSSPAGINCGSGCQAVFNDATWVTLTASPAAGSAFAGWSGGCSGTSTTCTVAMTADQTVTARFNTIPSPTHTLTIGANAGNGSGTVTSSPGAINCGTTCADSFDDGTTVVLTATPAPGSTFAGWTGGCSGLGSICEVTVSSDQTVTPTFNIAPTVRVLTVGTSSGTGSGTVTSAPSGITCGATCLHAFDDGTTVTLTAAPAAGSSFAGWSGGGCAGTTPTCDVAMISNQAVTATFIASGSGAGGGGTGGGTGGTGGTGGGGSGGGSGGSGSGSGGTGGGGGGHVSTAPKCTLNVGGRVPLRRSTSVPAGTISVTVRCDQGAGITLAGRLSFRARSRRGTRTRTASLRTVRAALKPGVAVVERLKVPASALAALRRGGAASAVLTLTAANGHGTDHASASIPRLHGV